MSNSIDEMAQLSFEDGFKIGMRLGISVGLSYFLPLFLALSFSHGSAQTQFELHANSESEDVLFMRATSQQAQLFEQDVRLRALVSLPFESGDL